LSVQRVFQNSLNSHAKQIIPKIFKGLSDEYVRIAALIIMKNQDTTIETINAWEKAGIIKTEWQKQRFINLIADSYQQDREKDK
jgi:enoyl-CoA hydratase/carnithine racemase